MHIPVSHGHLEAVLKEPDTTPRAAAVLCHPHPLFGGTMHTKAVYRAAQALNEAGLATMCVGAITTADQVNTILAAGRADLVALARPHLVDPFFAMRAAAS